MNSPLLSIIIPTYNRPHLLPRAVESALAQNIKDFEVLVIDDASPEPVNLPEHPRLRVIRLPENRGGAAARNVGASSARGRWITYLDDDDLLLPHMAQVSFEALAKADSSVPKPVAALSGIEVIGEDGQVKQIRLPPTLPKGCHFCLEEIKPGLSFFCKQTLVIEKEVLLSIGGFDESFSSRVHTDLFLRLNPICSLLGLPIVTYQLYEHQTGRVSSDPLRRQVNFKRLLFKQKHIFEDHPKMFANFIYDHVVMSHKSGQSLEAIKSLALALRIHPIHTLARMGSPLKRSLLTRLNQDLK